MGVNLTQKKGKIRIGPKLCLETMDEIDGTVLTRRVVASQIYGIFDPMGFVTPLTIKYKILLQQLSNDMGWDATLEGELANSARKELKEMVLARDIELPRLVKPARVLPGMELLGYWDGGNPALAACVYVIYELETATEEGFTHSVRLLAGKARVTLSSLKEGSMIRWTPRTEMRGLLLLARLVTAVLPGLAERPLRASVRSCLWSVTKSS